MDIQKARAHNSEEHYAGEKVGINSRKHVMESVILVRDGFSFPLFSELENDAFRRCTLNKI
jgi:hypothetical protein